MILLWMYGNIQDDQKMVVLFFSLNIAKKKKFYSLFSWTAKKKYISLIYTTRYNIDEYMVWFCIVFSVTMLKVSRIYYLETKNMFGTNSKFVQKRSIHVFSFHIQRNRLEERNAIYGYPFLLRLYYIPSNMLSYSITFPLTSSVLWWKERAA